jgi:hypothetical protein
MNIVTLLCISTLVLFYLDKISSKYAILLIGLCVLLERSNIEGMDGSVCGCSDLNSEALQNLASVYNSGSMTVTDLQVTGKLTVGGDITGNGNITGKTKLTAGDITSNGLTVNGDISAYNVNTTKGLTASGNVTGKYIIATNDMTATGDITGNNITANKKLASTGNLTVGNTLRVANSIWVNPATTLYDAIDKNTTVGTFSAITTNGNIMAAGKIVATDTITPGKLI